MNRWVSGRLPYKSTHDRCKAPARAINALRATGSCGVGTALHNPCRNNQRIACHWRLRCRCSPASTAANTSDNTMCAGSCRAREYKNALLIYMMLRKSTSDTMMSCKRGPVVGKEALAAVEKELNASRSQKEMQLLADRMEYKVANEPHLARNPDIAYEVARNQQRRRNEQFCRHVRFRNRSVSTSTQLSPGHMETLLRRSTDTKGHKRHWRCGDRQLYATRHAMQAVAPSIRCVLSYLDTVVAWPLEHAGAHQHRHPRGAGRVGAAHVGGGVVPHGVNGAEGSLWAAVGRFKWRRETQANGLRCACREAVAASSVYTL